MITTTDYQGATCTRPDVDPDWWWPLSEKLNTAQAQKALTYCLSCPLRQQCATETDPYRDAGSIRGGAYIPTPGRKTVIPAVNTTITLQNNTLEDYTWIYQQ